MTSASKRKPNAMELIADFLLGYPHADFIEVGIHFLDYTSEEYVVEYRKETGFGGQGLNADLTDALNEMLKLGLLEVKPIGAPLGLIIIYGRFSRDYTGRLWKHIDFDPPLTVNLTASGRRFATSLDKRVAEENQLRWHLIHECKEFPPRPETRDSLLLRLASAKDSREGR